VSVRAAVLTVSDRSAAGLRADEGGPIAVTALRDAGFECADARVVADGAAPVAEALRELLTSGARLVVTTGGTGIGPRDRTPEGTASVIERELPGIAEELRRRGAAEKPAGMLSRGLAGVAGGALIVNLPGAPKAVVAGMPVILSVAQHVIDQLAGADHAHGHEGADA
jgi:molybdenum cofactor synthesis domain-containing protein